jgi:vitamin B12 transporter
MISTLPRKPLTLLGLAVAMAGNAQAQTRDIEEITIIGGRLEETIPQDLARYGNQVEIITAEQLQQGGFVDVTQSLQMLVPGLHIRPKNGAFDYFDASLQGSRSTEILWLIDGVRITNRLYNGTSPLDTVPAHMIERIEVLKGGQGIFYGTQSVGGVINIVTRGLQQDTDGAVSVNAHSNGGKGLNGYVRGGNEQVQFVAYGSRDEADGYQPFRDRDFQPSATDRDRGYKVDLAGLKLGFQPTDNALLTLHYQRSEADLDFARPMLNYRTTNARTEDILTLKFDWQISERLDLFVKAYQHEWDTDYTRIYNTLDANGNVTGALRVINDNDYWGYDDDGLNAMLKYASAHGLEYIAGYDRQEFSGYDDVWRIGAQEETVDAWFGQVRTDDSLFENTMLAFGLRRNSPSNSADKTVWNFSGKHQLTDSLYLQSNIGTSFRLPDAEQLFLNEVYDYDQDGVPDEYFSVGNPNLKPEQSRNINISIGGNINALSWELTGFKRKITDYIESYVPVVIAGVDGESFANTDDQVKIDGFELQTALQLTPELGATFSYTDTRADLNGGSQLQGIPETEAKLRLDYAPLAQPFGLSLSVNHVGKLNERLGARRGNYTVMDLSGHYTLGANDEHQLVLRVENLTDKVYATRVERGNLDAGGTYLFDHLGMERTFHASYRYSF